MDMDGGPVGPWGTFDVVEFDVNMSAAQGKDIHIFNQGGSIPNGMSLGEDSLLPDGVPEEEVMADFFDFEPNPDLLQDTWPYLQESDDDIKSEEMEVPMDNESEGDSRPDVSATKAKTSHGGKHKKKPGGLKKAPGAPKRFKSPYLFFSIEMRDKIKQDMASDAKVTDIMKRIAEEWRKLSEEEKQEWQDKARRDRERYDSEMAFYRGPLKVPKIRSRKHPEAPKRAMSAFLYYSQLMRPQVKSEHRDMRSTDISKLLAEKWKQASDEEKHPYIEKEKVDRAVYKQQMAKWQHEHNLKKELAAQAEAAAAASSLASYQMPMSRPYLMTKNSPGPPVMKRSNSDISEATTAPHHEDGFSAVTSETGTSSLEKASVLSSISEDEANLEPDYMQSVRESFQVYDSFTQNLQHQQQMDGSQAPFAPPAPTITSIRPPLPNSFYGTMMQQQQQPPSSSSSSTPTSSTTTAPTSSSNTSTRGMKQHGHCNGMPPPPAPGQNGLGKGAYHPPHRGASSSSNNNHPVQQHHSSYPGYMIAALPSPSSINRFELKGGSRVVVKQEVTGNGPYQPQQYGDGSSSTLSSSSTSVSAPMDAGVTRGAGMSSASSSNRFYSTPYAPLHSSSHGGSARREAPSSPHQQQQASATSPAFSFTTTNGGEATNGDHEASSSSSSCSSPPRPISSSGMDWSFKEEVVDEQPGNGGSVHW